MDELVDDPADYQDDEQIDELEDDDDDYTYEDPVAVRVAPLPKDSCLLKQYTYFSQALLVQASN